MHESSMTLMRNFAEANVDLIEGSKILEVGSQNINGTYRGLFRKAASYVGIDVLAGKDVDIILKDPYKYPFEDEHFDLIISGNTLEHCRHPWLAIKEMYRVLRIGGKMCHTTPWRFHIHKDAGCPYDCWRILPDGMHVLYESVRMKVEYCKDVCDDMIGVAEK